MSKKIIPFIISILACLSSFAEELPKLPADPVYHCGKLPNGVSWYIAKNNSTVGRADFVLVQKAGNSIADSTGCPKMIARDALAKLPHFTKVSPQKFLTRKGALTGRHGFVEVTDDATIFRFNDILLADDKSVTDSTLLLLFDIVSGNPDCPFMSKWYSPSEQAIIVSGDVNPDEISNKLYYFSLMANSLETTQKPEYEWYESMAPAYEVEPGEENYSSVSVKWRMPRTPYEYMNTIQPAIFEMVVNELGYLASESVRDNMKKQGLPVARVKWEYVPSSATNSDEEFTVSLAALPENIETAIKIMAGTFSSICKGETDVREFVIAKKEYIASLAAKIGSPLKLNQEYTERAISSFLYNSSLASEKEKYDFYSSRHIPDTVELRLFNNIAAALLSDRDNMTVTCYHSDSSFTQESLERLFRKSWKLEDYIPEEMLPKESLYAELEPLTEKIKVSSRIDNASESFVWTYSNGFTVVYKKMPTARNMFYSLALNGGYGDFPKLQKGEGGFLSDYLKLCKINGCPGTSYFKMLREEGVYMYPSVSLSDTKLSGVAPVAKVPLVLNALVSVTNNRENDPESFDYFYKEQKLKQLCRTEGFAKMVAIDSIICPDNKYTSFTDISVLKPDFMDRADKFYKAQSSKMNDGLLVLVGDMDENQLKKMLIPYVGQFSTLDRAFYRSTYRYQPVTGTSVYTVEDDTDGIDVLLSAMFPFSAENDLAVQIAGMVLRRRLSDALADTGMYSDLSVRATIYPQERINVRVSSRLANPDGFASDIDHVGPIGALSLMRSCLTALKEIEVPEEELAIYKEYVKGRILIQQQDPAWWLDVITQRYIDGKDMYSNILNKLDNIGTAKISSVLQALANGSKVEYVTKNKNN